MKRDLKIELLTIQTGASLRETICFIDHNAVGFCFVMQGEFLKGVVTDGDIRRSLLKGFNLDQKVDEMMETNFFYLRKGVSLLEIQLKLKNYEIIPIVDDLGKLVDFATPQRFHQIPVVEPVLQGKELEYVTDCVSTGWISSQGKYVKRFEQEFANYTGAEHALSVSNGTVALHLALVALGIGTEDEVIVPDLTFVSPLNAVLYVGAKPVILDVDPNTVCLNVDLIEGAITEKTKAIIPVHLYGHPVDMNPLMEIAQKYNLKVIEDCAEAVGSYYHGKHVGCFGDAATFSFFGNKTITTGEGGMILFKKQNVFEKAQLLRDHGMSKETRYWHEEVGYNYRLTNLQAAVGVAQLERADYLVSQKRWMAEVYEGRLKDSQLFSLPGEYGDVVNSYWLYTIYLKNPRDETRDSVLDQLRSYGIQSRPVFYSMHRMPPYQKYAFCSSQYHNSLALSKGGISLPSSASVTIDEINRVCDALNEIEETLLTS